MAASIVYLLNAFFGDRFERRSDSALRRHLVRRRLVVYAVHSTVWVDTFYIIATVGTILWLWGV